MHQLDRHASPNGFLTVGNLRTRTQHGKQRPQAFAAIGRGRCHKRAEAPCGPSSNLREAALNSEQSVACVRAGSLEDRCDLSGRHQVQEAGLRPE